MRKIFLFTLFLLLIIAPISIRADNTCKNMEEILLDSDLTSNNPFYVNEEYLNLNLLGLQLYINEGENFYRVLRVDYNHPSTYKNISENDLIYKINGNVPDYNKYNEILDSLSEAGMIMDEAFSLDLKYVLMMGLDQEFQNEEFSNNLEKNYFDKQSFLKKYDNIDISLELEVVKESYQVSAVENLETEFIRISTSNTSIVPTVLTNLDLYNVSLIDGRNQTFDAGYAVEFSYIDRYNMISSFKNKLGEFSEYSYAWCEWSSHDDADIWGEIEYIWKPDIDFINRLDYDKDKTLEKISVYYFWATELEPATLNIYYETRGSASFSTDFNYKTFPFDSQYISIDIANHDGSGFGNHYSVSNVDFYTSLFQTEIGKSTFKDPRETFSDQINVSGWKLDEKSTYKENFTIWEAEMIEDSTITSVFGIEQLIKRNEFYFMFKIFSPILLILIICWSVFWSPPKELESRLTVTITCFLALVAYTFVIDDDLPKLSYLTLMDQIILVSYFFASLPTIFAIFAHRLSLNDNNNALRFDRIARLLGLIGYPAFSYFLIHLATKNNLNNTSDLLRTITFN